MPHTSLSVLATRPCSNAPPLAAHTANPVHYFQPTSAGAVQQILSMMHEAGARLRVVGSALSPNGLGLSDEAMLNMAQCDAVLSVDAEKRQATVQAGARVADVVEALRPHGLTLQNYASIAEQQIGGFLQVGAHGTGAGVPPVDEQIIRMVLHTPALGALELSAEKSPRLFYLARVGLGWLGVVSEVTIQCVPAHKLLQHTYTQTREQVARLHTSNLRHQHMRYMWIPHTDTVVVVTLNPVPEGAPIPAESDSALAASQRGKASPPPASQAPERELRELLLQKSQAAGAPRRSREVEEMNFAQLRDALLALSPLDKQHVIEVNRAEAAFWRASEGYRVDWSDRLLGFECGGQQWVSEVAFPCGTRSQPDGADLRYMHELLALIESSDLPTPAPIEQRWTLRSKSPMSPAHSAGEDDLHSWVVRGWTHAAARARESHSAQTPSPLSTTSTATSSSSSFSPPPSGACLVCRRRAAPSPPPNHLAPSPAPPNPHPVLLPACVRVLPGHYHVPAHPGGGSAGRDHQALLGVQPAVPREALVQVRLPPALGEDRVARRRGRRPGDAPPPRRALPSRRALRRQAPARPEGRAGQHPRRYAVPPRSRAESEGPGQGGLGAKAA